jgi:hypothetical protein
MHETADRRTGSTAEIELAHKALDEVGIREGSLAQRTLWLVGRYYKEV